MPVTFDAKSNGATSFNTGFSWSHTATEGADVFVDVLSSAGVARVTYGGAAMTLLSTSSWMKRYHLAAVAGGAKSVVVSTGNGGGIGCARSYIGVQKITDEALIALTGGTAASQTVTVDGSGKMALQAFMAANASASGAGFATPAGGTNRYNGTDGNRTGICCSDAPTTTTFTATGTPSYYNGWAAIAHVLDPGVSPGQFFIML